MRLLVTGGCGFVGSNFIRFVLQHYGPEMVTNVDALTTGNLANVAELAETYGDRYEFLHARVGDAERIEAVLAKHQYFGVVHTAGEACDPMETRQLLDAARRHGARRFLLVSSDCGHETTADMEQMALTAFGEHGQEIVIARATDNYGPFQPLTGFIPATTLHALRNEPAPISGDGTGTRDWLHVSDHCAALFTALLDGRAGAVYRVATGHESSDLDVAHRILEQLGKGRDLVQFLPKEMPPSPLRRSLAEELPCWKPRHSFELGLRATIDWYVRNRQWWEPLLKR